jgi:hypothetical protein
MLIARAATAMIVTNEIVLSSIINNLARLLMLDTYYLLQKCPTWTPPNANVAGVTLNVYFRNTKPSVK